MAETDRRGFLKVLNVAIGGLVGAVLAVPLIRYFAFPFRRKIVSGPDDPVPIASAKDLTRVPLRVEIVVPEQRDGWSKVENVRLGAAWVFRDDSGAVRAFTTTCPHLGCAVDYDKVADKFRCPCHTSQFDRDGARISGPAKRGLDPLPTSIDDDGMVRVRFLRFKPDVPDREEA
ncbi:MAG TPA: ubiquinol-cytochrome c reductase iron-sulfur subunit [Haliangiales bacterium]|nr:ubiquinol-cytochrome c reductase iron-sulfur subunit [Haliangiales bacterium]